MELRNEVIHKFSFRTLANNFFILLTTYELNFLSTSFLNSYNEKRLSASNSKKSIEKWETCLENVITFMDFAVYSLHYEVFVCKSLRAEVEKFSRQLLDTYVKLIQSSEYLSQEAKNEFKDKVKKYKMVVGYSDEILNVSNLEKYYRDWEIADDGFFEMSISLQLEKEKQLFRKLQKDFVYLPDYAKNIARDKLHIHENFAVIDETLCRLMICLSNISL